MIRKHLFNIVLLTLVFAALFVTIVKKTYSAVPDGTILSSDILLPLKIWIEKNSSTKIASLPIIIASGMQLKTGLGLQGTQQKRAIAAYVPGRIIINNVIWDPQSKTAMSYLLHELVHHAQILNQTGFPCAEEKNRLPYTLQNKWLKENGEEPLYTDEWINEISSCPKN